MQHLSLLLLLLAAGPSQAQFHIGQNTTLDFATVGEAQTVLTARDDYIQRLSPFDRAAKILTDRETSEAEYLAAISANILPWTEPEKAKINAAFEPLQAQLTALSLPLPPKILLIRTDGDDEGGACYTRGNAIVFASPSLQESPGSLSRLLCHEIFHVLSRANPELREKLYRVIGFHKCGEVSLPSDLEPRRITNPDAPIIEHCVKVEVDGESHWVAPVLFANAAKIDPAKGGTFLNYLQFRLLAIDFDPNTGLRKSASPPHAPKFIAPNEAGGFFEQIGRNTRYIIHPEEILADNFVHLIQGTQDLPSPGIVEEMARILKETPGKTAR
ncbi:MAG TPA: hypothetical protein VD994_13955 [Prosthecobacter sp.]|nr:hypothetical protein [Prosthecobacter sp.]